MSVLAATASLRNIPDQNLLVTTALAAAAGTTTCTAFDTGDNTSGFFPERVELLVTVPATTNLVSGATLTFDVVADTANPPTTVLSPPLSYVITGTAGNGAAGTARWRLPPNTGRYVAIKQTSGTSGGGNNTAVSYTAQLLF